MKKRFQANLEKKQLPKTSTSNWSHGYRHTRKTPNYFTDYRIPSSLPSRRNRCGAHKGGGGGGGGEASPINKYK
jgi:hypothetical protein